MALPRKLTERIYEIKAHTGNVSCLDVGETGRVLVTGGQDRNVNLWAIGQTECFMSLTGHNRPVDCVRFAYNDDFVYSADDIGIIRRWDLNAQTICSTLNGHMKSVRTLDFNPSGEYVISGSNDTTVRLWDVRNQNSCMKVYRGHISHVNSVKFSPDGLWIASAGNEGSVIIWDIRKSKQIMEFCEKPTASAITCIQFHPFELLLAVGQVNGTICIYDLETKQRVTKMDGPSVFQGQPIRCFTFSENGECLFAGTSAAVSVIGWEPDREFDHIISSWTMLGDMKIVNRRLFCGSFEQDYVAIDALSVNRVYPFYNPSNARNSFAHNTTARKSFSRGNQKLRLSIGGLKQTKLTEENEENRSPSLDGHSSPNLSLELVDENASELSPTTNQLMDANGVSNDNGINSLTSNCGEFDSSYSSMSINIPSTNKKSTPFQHSMPTNSGFVTLLSGGEANINYDASMSLRLAPMERNDMYDYENYLEAQNYQGDEELQMNESYAPVIVNYDHTEMAEDFPVNTNTHQQHLQPNYHQQQSNSNHTNNTVNAISSTTNVTGTGGGNLTSSINSNTNSNPLTKSSKSRSIANNNSHISKRSITSSNHKTNLNTCNNSNIQTMRSSRLSQMSSVSSTELNRLDDNTLIKKSASSHVVVMANNNKAKTNSNKENSQQQQRNNKNQIPVHFYTKGPTRSRTSLDLQTSQKQNNIRTTNRISNYITEPSTNGGVTSHQTVNSYRPDSTLFASAGLKNNNNRQSTIKDSSEIEMLSSSHEQVYQELSNRQATLQLIRNSTRSHNVIVALKQAIKMGRTVFVDLLGAILEKTSSWNLDMCMLLLPEIYELLQSQHKFHYTRACDSLRVILSNFLPIIQDNLDPWANGIGVDVSREERHRKCLECQRWLLQIRNLPETNHSGTTLTQLQNLIINI